MSSALKGLNKQQLQKVQQFKEFTQCDDTVAAQYLKQAKWNIEDATNEFYTNPPQISGGGSKSGSKSQQNLESLFSKYASKDEENVEKIKAQGIIQFCKDLGITPLDPVILVISYHFQAVRMGQYTQNEFVDGMNRLRCDSIEALKKQLNQLKNSLDDENFFREFYKFIFAFAKDPNQKGLKFEGAKQLWGLLFEKKFKLIKEWIEFLDIQSQKNDVTNDQWNMFYEFVKSTKGGDLAFYNEADAWTVMIDEFVEFVKTKQNSQN